MPHITKIDLSNPQTILEVLKAGGLDGREVIIDDTGNSVVITPLISASESRKRLGQAFAGIELDPNAVSDVDSQWWIETIKSARVNKETTVDFDDEP